jgi:chromosome segregation ATPase
MEGVQMSDTPISDSTPHNVADLGMRIRMIERELNAANAIIRQQQLLDEANLRLQDHIKRLEEWKESALAVEREWDANAIATLLGAKLGESQRKVIQREVPLLLERIKRLEKSSQQLKSLNNKICEINLKVSQERHDSNVRIKQLEQENDALRADLLLWDKAGIGFTTEDKP